MYTEIESLCGIDFKEHDSAKMLVGKEVMLSVNLNLK